jgi:hypothetical protein
MNVRNLTNLGTFATPLVATPCELARRGLNRNPFVIMSALMRRSTADRTQQAPGREYLDSALDTLERRELLEPALLLSAGYVALPFLLRQGLLLLTPLLALCGFRLEREESTRAVSE